MCNLFNTLFGRNVNSSCCYNSCNNACGTSGCGWHCGWQRVCRDCNGNIVVVGNSNTSTQNNTSNSCNYGCQRRCGFSVAQANVSNVTSEDSDGYYGYARCRSQRTSCGCNY
ncbi:MAG: hypothetical protein IJD77_06140 [Clostridia bacterium]|nr:hypothetical protein [Clostridia bacterium]